MVFSEIKSQPVFHYEKNGVKITKLITNARIVIDAFLPKQYYCSFRNIIKSLGGKITYSSGEYLIYFSFETYSKCNPEDEYNKEIGERIAKIRANKLLKTIKLEIIEKIEKTYNTLFSRDKAKLARGIYADIKRLENYVKPNNSSRQ